MRLYALLSCLAAAMRDEARIALEAAEAAGGIDDLARELLVIAAAADDSAFRLEGVLGRCAAVVVPRGEG
jgi:hypothetical protein